ncbi:MAG: phenylacetate--CoA ligase family protein [Sphingobacteriales bacterium]|nr:MAG: phenylacetate--CoA ligase family protein [Sphingobacteriales bacterium]
MRPDWFQYILKLQGYPIAQAKAELKCIQSLSVDAFHSWQSDAKWSIAKHHYQHNEFYKKKVGNIFPNRWEDLPIITKQDLQQPLANIISNNISLKNCYTASTSGSSGTPFFFAKDKFAHAMTWAVIADRYKWCNIDQNALQARFYGIPKEAAGKWKEQLKDTIMHRQRFDVFDLSDARLEQYLKRFTQTPFKYIYGYTNSLVLFARYLVSKNVVLNSGCPTLSLCISTSEVATPEDHALLQQAFGVSHIREYGVSETCLTGFDHPSGNWLLTEETLFNEVAEDGTLLSTSLFNKALPMVRYEVGDRIQLNPELYGGKYHIINQLQGRINDTIHLPSGKVAAGLTFYYISRSILERTNSLKEFIIRQTAIDTFIFDIVSNRELTIDETNEIKNKTALYLEPGLKVVVNRVPQIQRTQAGKLKNFYSELAQVEKDSHTNPILSS